MSKIIIPKCPKTFTEKDIIIGDDPDSSFIFIAIKNQTVIGISNLTRQLMINKKATKGVGLEIKIINKEIPK